jgi:alanyl-tRNA synthetase
MQLLKPKFQSPDGTSHGNIQYCVRTNDLDLVGDGTHLTFFQMIGSFGFGTNDYEHHVELWVSIMRDLSLPISYVNVSYLSHFERFWERYYPLRYSDDCVWSDGNIGGYCSELFTESGLEVGNLVNPLGHSVDVGFGYERMLQVMSGSDRVDQTELFRQDLDPVSRDHFRTLFVLEEQGINPGNKGRNYVCRRLLRRYLRLNPDTTDFPNWSGPERDRIEKSLREGRRYFKRNPDKPEIFWWDTFGILPEELALLK